MNGANGHERANDLKVRDVRFARWHEDVRPQQIPAAGKRSGVVVGPIFGPAIAAELHGGFVVGPDQFSYGQVIFHWTAANRQDQRPVQFGERFSENANGPSM